MTRPIFEPSLARTDARLGYTSSQLARRPAPTPSGVASIPFCYAQTSCVSVSGGLTSFNIANFGSGTTFKTNDSTIFPGIYHDTGKNPEYGIRIPANYLVEVTTWLWICGGVADGAHSVSWVYDGAYSVSTFGIASNSNFTSSAASGTGVADDTTAPEALFLIAQMGDTSDWTVGTIHEWENWTNDPQDFQYGINVKVLGDLPT